MIYSKKFIALSLFLCSTLLLLSGCPMQGAKQERRGAKTVTLNPVDEKNERLVPQRPIARPQAPSKPVEPPAPAPTADKEVVDAVIAWVDGLGPNCSYKLSNSGAMIELSISTNDLKLEDVQRIAKLSDLTKLTFNNCRDFSDEYTEALLPLKEQLDYLQIGNGIITNESGKFVAQFVNLTELNLHHNANIGDAFCAELITNDPETVPLKKLEKLNMIYTGLTQTGLIHVRKLPNLSSLDIRGCTVIGDAGMRNVAKMPNLKSFLHYTGSASDAGLEQLSAVQNETQNIEMLHLQDFRLTDAAGPMLAKFTNLKTLILFRCGEFGSEGLKALKGMELNRLTLRGLPNVGNDGFEVFQDMPKLTRLYLTEMDAISDEGVANLSAVQTLEILEIEVMAVTDRTVKTISELKNLKELKLRSTEITNDSLDLLLKMPKLQTLRLLDNARIDESAAKGLLEPKEFKTLEIGKTRGELSE